MSTQANKSLNQGYLKYLDVGYFVKLISLVLFLYYFNIYYIDKTEPQTSIYSPFFGQYLNYPRFLVNSILHTASFILNTIGFNAHVVEAEASMRVANHPGIIMAPACIGLGIMSFWFAFIIAERNTWKKKLFWCFTGLVSIWLLNCFRMALLLIAMENKWPVPSNQYLDHHRLFNLCVYGLIILMMYAYYRFNKKTSPSQSAQA